MEFLKDKNEIIKWLDSNNICDYDIIETKIKKYPYVVHAHDNVDISGQKLSFVPVKFNKIFGNLDCSNNSLIYLNFCPSKVGGSAYFNKNKISSLKGIPKTIGQGIDLSDNCLSENSLNYFPLNINLSAPINLKNNPNLKNFQYASISDIQILIEDLKKRKETTKNKNKLEKELKINKEKTKSKPMKI